MYHDGFAGPPILFLHDQGMRNDQHGIANEGECCCKRDPFKDSLLCLGNVIVDGPLDKVACRVGCGQWLASRAGSGGFGDISIRISCCDAAESEDSQEEGQHEDGIGILEDCDRRAQSRGMAPSRGIDGEQLLQLGVGEDSSHGVFLPR